MLVTAITDIPTLVLGGSAFVLVMALWLAALLVWNAFQESRDKKIEDRLRKKRDQGERRLLRLWSSDQGATTTVRVSGKDRGLMARLAHTLNRAGWEDIPPERFVLLTVLCCFTCAILVLVVTLRLWLAVTVPVVGILLLNMLIQHKITQRETVFERQFLDSMRVAASSLRAGHPLSGALNFVSSEVDPPVGDVFAEICEQQNLGVDLQEAVREVAERTGNNDMKLFATSIAVQVHSGGNIADMMDRLGEVIRDRVRRRHRMRVITAQTQFTKRALMAFPFIFIVLMNLVHPGYTDPLFETSNGQVATLIAGTLLLLGGYVMNKMTKLTV